MPPNFARLFAIHDGVGFDGNLARLVEATNSISPTGHKFAVDAATRATILAAPRRAITFVHSQDAATLKAELDAKVDRFRNEIRDAGQQAILAGNTKDAQRVVADARRLAAIGNRNAFLREQGEPRSDELTGMAAGNQLMAIRREREGRGDEAFNLARQGERQEVQAQFAQQIGSAGNDRDRERLTARRDQNLQLFDEQTAQQVDQRRRRREADTQSVIAAQRQATLRSSQQFYAADLAAFDDATRAKLSLITDLEQRQNEAARSAAQRSILVSEQGKRIASTDMDYIVAGETATLRAQGRNRDAEIVAFDRQTEREREQVDEANREAFEKSRQEQRDALIQSQLRERQELFGSLRTREQQAVARGQGQDRLAGVIGSIGEWRRNCVLPSRRTASASPKPSGRNFRGCRTRSFGRCGTRGELHADRRVSTVAKAGWPRNGVQGVRHPNH